MVVITSTFIIGSDVQAYDADLITWAGLTPSAYFQTLVNDADAATAQATLGLVIGTNVQAWDAQLDTWATLTPSAFFQTLVDDADALTARATLGLVIGTNVQAYDADLATWAGLTPSAYFQTLIDDADAGTARGTLGLGTIATQASDSVSITGGSITGITDLTVADGGTGASTAAGARVNLLPSLSGNTLKFLRVNAGETDVEWAAIAGGGDVSKVGTPVNNQVGVWTGDGTLEGDAALTYDSGTDTLTSVTFAGALTGNASTATALATARSIGGVNFDGTANIVPATITVANEATDATSFIAFFTAASGDLGPKTNANMTFAADTGIATFASVVLTTADINGGTVDGAVIGGATPAAGTFTTLIITSFGGNWTNAGRTVADMGVVTTIDINGGTIDGVTIGGSSAGAITGTNITANTNFLPDANDGAGLGISGTAFSDLFLASGAVINFNAGNVTLTHAAGVLTIGGSQANGIELVLAAGGTALPPLLFQVGTLMTTPADGAIEMDATNFYGTTDAGNRGYIPVRHFIRADAARNLTDSTAAQAIFNSPTNGQLTLETGTYYFEMMFALTAMSATSGNAQVLFGGTATMGTWLWMLQGLDATAVNTTADLDGPFQTTNASAASAVAAAVNTTMRVFARGTFEVTVAGTIIPQVDLVTGGVTPALAAGSYFMVERIGTETVVSVGQWD